MGPLGDPTSSWSAWYPLATHARTFEGAAGGLTDSRRQMSEAAGQGTVGADDGSAFGLVASPVNRT